MAENSLTPQLPSEAVITLELLAEGPEQDQALVFAVGRDTADVLEQDGYTVRPTYTGQKGGGFLVEVVTTTMQFVWTYHEELIADLSGLLTIFGTILPIMQKMVQSHARQVGQTESAAHPITITITIDGQPVTVEASDVEQAEAALKLARRYHSVHHQAAVQASPRSKVKVQGQIPSRQKRRRK